MKYGVVLFHTTTSALRAEKAAVRAGLQVKLVPTPRHLSSDCGIALRFAWDDRDTLTALLADACVEGDLHSL